MKKFKSDRKGDLVSSQIILIIILIVGFAILLIFLYYVKQGYSIDKEACHQSVIFRATSPEEFKSEIPLKCQTEKVCFTTKSSNVQCEVFAGEKFQTVKVADTEELKEKIAGLIYDCWWMMGEGKAEIFQREMTAAQTTEKCVICSRFDFDKNDEKLKGELGGIYEHLEQTKIKGSDLTYLEFLNGYRGARLQGKVDDKISFVQYSIIYVESSRTVAPEMIGSILGVGAGLFVGRNSIATVGGGYLGYEAGAFIGGLLGDKYAWAWVMRPYTTEDLKETKCKSFENLA